MSGVDDSALTSPSGIRRAAVAMARHARKIADSAVPTLEMATVVSVQDHGPIEALLLGGGVTLDTQHNLTLSVSVKMWHANFGLRRGDTLLVTRDVTGEWLAVDAFSDTEVTPF